MAKGRHTGRSNEKDAPPPNPPWSWRKRRRCLIRIWVISSSSWACPPRIRPCTCLPVPVMTKMLKRTERRYRDTVETTAAVGGDTRSGILTITAGRVGKKEGSRGRNMAELNWNQTPYRGRA